MYTDGGDSVFFFLSDCVQSVTDRNCESGRRGGWYDSKSHRVASDTGLCMIY